MDRNVIGLTDIVPFKEDDRWYFKLVYKYEDKNGKRLFKSYCATMVTNINALTFDHCSVSPY